jgi:NhaP-type Na+/H+ or K+/H+ antiporter
MRRQDFASQFPYILMFAFIGTGITAAVIGLLVKYTGLAGWHSITSSRTAFAYGALMSATDPIAALATYNSLKVDPLLNALVFGESALNDSVAIVLFNVLNNDALVATMTSPLATTWTIIWNMAYLFFGSMAIGLGTGFLYVLVLRFGGLDNHYKVETLFIIVSCYLTSACAEMVLCSGIIAVFFEGIIMGIYAKPHLSKSGSLMANFFVKQIVALCDMLVFLLTGVAVVRLTLQGLSFGGLVMLFCFFARAVSVFPVGCLSNLVKKYHASRGRSTDPHYLSWKDLAMMTHAGLRGAIAMVLCMELGDWVDKEEGEGTTQMLQTCTFFHYHRVASCPRWVHRILFATRWYPIWRRRKKGQSLQD